MPQVTPIGTLPTEVPWYPGSSMEVLSYAQSPGFIGAAFVQGPLG